MIVQHLPRWLRKVVASLFHHTHSTHLLPPERTAVLSATLRGDVHSTSTASASWLDDGRRLRLRPSPPAKLDQRWNPRAATPRQPVPTQPQPGRAPSLRPAAEQPAPELPRPNPAEPAATRAEPAPPTQPAPTNDTPLTAFGASSSMAEQYMYRRLMALRRLVRMGIYNEGFDPNRVPEQYLYSLGREDDLGADSIE
ncbi:MAG TPA: hypothetical protein VKQ30_18595 [Ktedonobacterales bacterium]|nr:hypothetical protein [Ktedonobacterales bacterium]